MVDVDSYIKKLTPKGQRSSLKPFEEAIMKLRENGASLQQVVEFLAENGTTTTIGNVSKFIKKVTEKAAESPAKPKPEKQNPPAAGLDKGSDSEVQVAQDNPPATGPARGVRKRKEEPKSNKDWAEQFYTENSGKKIDILGNDETTK